MLGARGQSTYGSLQLGSFTPSSWTDTMYFEISLDAGVPIVGDVLQVFVDDPITCELATVSRKGAIVFESEKFNKTTRICGIPNATLTVIASSSTFQVVAYLFEVNILGVGKLLAHGPHNIYGNATVGAPYSFDRAHVRLVLRHAQRPQDRNGVERV